MKITREKACQRLHHRVATPLNLYHDGRRYTAVDWSLGGFRISDWDALNNDFAVGDRLSWTFELPFQGFMIGFDVTAEAVRSIPETGQLACQFIDLDDRQTELMNHFIEQLVRGAMVPLKDTILRIDSPVTPVSTEPKPSPIEQLPVSRIPLPMVMMSLLYLTLGIGLFSLATITLYDNFLSLKVNTAATSAPRETIVSLVDGRISRVSTTLDSPINEGMPLLTIESPLLTKQIAESKIQIEQKKLELEAQRKRYRLAIKTTGSVNSPEVSLLQIDIDLVEQEVRLAMQDLLALYAYQEDLSILSPGDGRLVQLVRERGAVIKRGEILAIFERDEAPVVDVFVTEQEARLIYLDQLTQVHLLSLDQQWLGYVSEIRKDTRGSAGSQFSYGLQRSYESGRTSGRNVRIEITLQMDSSERLKLRSGLPVEVRFATTAISRAVFLYMSNQKLDQELDQELNQQRSEQHSDQIPSHRAL